MSPTQRSRAHLEALGYHEAERYSIAEVSGNYTGLLRPAWGKNKMVEGKRSNRRWHRSSDLNDAGLTWWHNPNSGHDGAPCSSGYTGSTMS